MKRLRTAMLAVALLTTVGATMATAADIYPPGPPYRSCGDTLTLYSIQQTDTTLAPCHPATLDTVLGVRGVITGFDPRGSGYGFYIQNGTGPWTGLNVFTGSWNYLTPIPGTPTGGNLVLGDSVVVYGRTQEFPATNGWTEIEGPDGTQGTNDIIIRLISNPGVPPMHTTSVAEMTWLTAENTTAEQWEGCLVYLPGPLTVGRISGTGIASGNFLATCATCGTDSVLVDQFTLTTTVGPVAPPVGTAIESITGIVNQNATNSVSSYRIQIRSGNDLVTSTPPSLTDAYPIEDDNAGNEQLRLVFDKNLDQATAEDEANYSLSSGIDGSTIDNAVMETVPGNVVILTITSVRVDGDIETVSAAGIGSATCPSCLISPQQSRTFINGVLTCARVQQPDPSFLPLYDDRSQFAGTGALAGTKFTVRGTAVNGYGALYYIVDEDGAQRGGLSVFAPIAPLTAGERYRISGQVQEFGGETELVFSTLITNEGAGALPTPAVQTIAVLADTTTDMTESVTTGEDYECMLVKLVKVMVAETRTVGQSFFVADLGSPDTFLVSNLNGVLNAVTPPDSGRVVDVVGVLHFTNGTFRICPRDGADIIDPTSVGVGPRGRTELALNVTPNPARNPTLSFALPRADHVQLGVFDLQGRQVAQLVNGRLPAGEYTRVWAGTNSSGQRANPGVFFYRLKVGAETRVVRGVLIQ